MKINAQVHESYHEVTVERHEGLYTVTIDGEERTVDARALDGDFLSILDGNKSFEVSVAAEADGYHVRHGGFETYVRFADPTRDAREGFGAQEGPVEVLSVMPGKVVRVLVREGDEVSQGQGVVVIEAMKMENEIEAPKDGVVTSVAVEPGQAIETGGRLIVVE